jgi:hypothetical protein
MEYLESFDQVLWQAPEPLRDMRLELLCTFTGSTELPCNLLLAQRVVLKFLRSLGVVYLRSEHVMKAELAREYVHHDTRGCLLIPPGITVMDCLWCFTLQRQPVQDVLVS